MNIIHTKTYQLAEFDTPTNVSVDAGRSTLVVTNTAKHELLVVTQDGQLSAPALAAFGTDPSAEGLSFPLSTTIDTDGNLYVVDTGNDEVDRYAVDSNGNYAYDANFLGGTRRTLNGTPLHDPTDADISGNELFVLDGGNYRVVSVDLSTGASTTVITDDTWVDPVGLAATSNGVLYVVDRGDHRVRKYVNGSLAKTFGGHGSGDGQLRQPYGVTTEGDRVYVADGGNQRIQVFNNDGNFVDTFGSPDVFGSIKGITHTGADTVFVADAGRNAVHKFSTNVTDPSIQVNRSTLDFGEVETGFGLRLLLTVSNEGGMPLTVSDVTTDGSVFQALEQSFTVAPGQDHTFAVEFTPTEESFEGGRLLISSNDPSTPVKGVMLRGEGRIPQPVDAVLVLDHSGSMGQSAGQQTKMEALAQAASLFVDLLRPEVGDRVGVVGFDNESTTQYPLTLVSEDNSTQTAVISAIGQLIPGGDTSIGAGVQRAYDLLTSVTDPNRESDSRKVIVVVSDGIENTQPYVAKGEPDQRIDLDDYDDVSIYTIGLGLGAEVDLNALSKLAETFQGKFHLTEERWLSLPKFFVETLGDAIGEYIALDPPYTVEGNETTSIVVDLAPEDHVVTFILYWDDPRTEIDLTLRTPDGMVLSDTGPWAARRRRGPTYEYVRVEFPQSTGVSDGGGRWVIEMQGRMERGETATFGLSVLVRSSIGIDCSLLLDSDVIGPDGALEFQLTESGQPIAIDSIEGKFEVPTHSRGELLADLVQDWSTTGDNDLAILEERFNWALTRPIGPQRRRVVGLDHPDEFVESLMERISRSGIHEDLPDEGLVERFDVSTDYANETTRLPLAVGIVHDPRLRERTFEPLNFEEVEREWGPTYRTELPPLENEGTYGYRVVLTAERNGLTIRRECSHSFAIVSRPSLAETNIVVDQQIEGELRDECLFVVTPRDEAGNLLGPGLDVTVNTEIGGSEVHQEIVDLGDGSYQICVNIPHFDSLPELEEIDGINHQLADRLHAAEITTLRLSVTSRDELESIEGVSRVTASGLLAIGEELRTNRGIDKAVVRLRANGTTLEYNLYDLLAGVSAGVLTSDLASRTGPPTQ